MEERKKSAWPWIILAIVLGLLLLCAVSAVAGAAGYFLGFRAVSTQPTPALPERQIVPVIPVPPTAPALPWSEQRLGALIVSVVPEGPAQAAGLQVGDIIYRVNDAAFDQENDLATAIGQYEPGDTVTLSVWRGGQTQEIHLKLGRNPNKPGETPWVGVEYRMVPFALSRQRN